MALIPEEVLQEIRERVDLVELVSESVQLKRRGRNFVGLCPFHREKTPSFNVNAELQIYKCFGCGVGGNALTYLRAREGLEFREAARRLAARAGIELPAEGTVGEPRTKPLLEANALAAEFYARALKESAEAEPARAYLQAREVSAAAAEVFRLGWAPGGWDALLAAARAVGLPDSALLEAGLVSRSEKTGGLYDRFRARVMFPIQDVGGRTVGFSGRLLEDAAGVPKYLNSPETEVFRKGALLFGLAVTRNAVRRAEEAIVVEGNFDLLSLYDRGFLNVVAPLGTALTTEQALLLKRYASRAVLLYDSDEAGRKAAFRSGDELLARGFAVRLAFLPPDSDPDSFVRTAGPAALRELLRGAPDLVAAKLGVLRERLDLSRVDAKRRAIELLLRSIRRIPDPITRDLQLAFVAQELAVPREMLRQAAREPAGAGRSRRTEPGPARAAPAGRSRIPRLDRQKLLDAEKYMLLMLIRRPERVPAARSEIVPEDFTSYPCRRIYELLLELEESRRSPSEQILVDRADAQVQPVLAEILLSEIPLEPEEQMFRDVLLTMKELAKERDLAEVRREPLDLEAVTQAARERTAVRNPRSL
jgi:DNA primase